jgi:hypothetical protein
MRALSFRPFYPSDSRRVSLWYLSAGLRYTAGRGWVVYFMEGQCIDESLNYNAYVRAVRSMHP